MYVAAILVNMVRIAILIEMLHAFVVKFNLLLFAFCLKL